ncbi:hypothetical protein SAMN04487843_12070 [Methylobacterium sp. ap11]|nr:hypothetical protein SAMN04487843_12070 [Methylobacterium sp. ap11]
MAPRYAGRLAGLGIEPSVGSVGDSCDNARAETVGGLFRAEVIHRRLLAPIGNVPPAEAEMHSHTHVGDQALAA